MGSTGFPVTSFSLLLQDSDSENFHYSWHLSVVAGFLATLSINPPRYASFSLFWELDAAWGFEFFFSLHKVSLKIWVSPDFLLQSDLRGWGTRRNSWRQVHYRRLWFCHFLHSSFFCYCILYAIVLVQLINLESLAQQSGAEMDDCEQMKKIVPFVTCEIAFSRNVSELMFGVDVPDLNFRI